MRSFLALHAPEPAPVRRRVDRRRWGTRQRRSAFFAARERPRRELEDGSYATRLLCIVSELEGLG